jgi:hypothetical protein
MVPVFHAANWLLCFPLCIGAIRPDPMLCHQLLLSAQPTCLRSTTLGLAEQREGFCLVFKAEYIIPYAACSLTEDSVVWR